MALAGVDGWDGWYGDEPFYTGMPIEARECVRRLKADFAFLDFWEHVRSIPMAKLVEIERDPKKRIQARRFWRRVRELRLKGKLTFPRFVREALR